MSTGPRDAGKTPGKQFKGQFTLPQPKKVQRQNSQPKQSFPKWANTSGWSIAFRATAFFRTATIHAKKPKPLDSPYTIKTETPIDPATRRAFAFNPTSPAKPKRSPSLNIYSSRLCTILGGGGGSEEISQFPAKTALPDTAVSPQDHAPVPLASLSGKSFRRSEYKLDRSHSESPKHCDR